MAIDKNLFEEPYELEAFAELSEYPIPKKPVLYKRESLRGYKKGLDYFYRIVRIFRNEMYYNISLFGINSIFEKTYSMLYGDFFKEFKMHHDVSDAIVDHIKKLEAQPYTFDTMKAKRSSKDHSKIKWENIEITIPQVCGLIGKLRKHRIEFYNRVLHEYIDNKKRYNQLLKEFFKSKSVGNSINYKVERPQLDINFINLHNESKHFMSQDTYNLSISSWRLKDLMRLGVSGLDKYYLSYKELPRYNSDNISASKIIIDSLFLLFSIFKAEMDYILTTNLDKSFSEKVLRVLFRDFHDDFAKNSDLEESIIHYIKELEQYTFFSLEKSEFYRIISQMLINLRQHRIMFYEVILQEYQKNKAQYDAKLTKNYEYFKEKEERSKERDDEETSKTNIAFEESPTMKTDKEINPIAYDQPESNGKPPNRMDPLLRKFFSYSLKREKEGILKIGRLLIKENPNDGSSYHLVGQTLAEFGEYEEAAKILQKAIELEPSYWNIYDSYFHLAMCYTKLRKFDLAHMTLDKGDHEVEVHGWMGSGGGREIGEVWKEKRKMVKDEIDDLK